MTEYELVPINVTRIKPSMMIYFTDRIKDTTNHPYCITSTDTVTAQDARPRVVLRSESFTKKEAWFELQAEFYVRREVNGVPAL